MNRQKWVPLLVLAALILGGMAAGVQAAPLGPQPPDAAMLAQLDAASGGAAQVFRHAETGKVRFIELPAGHPLPAPRSLAAATPEQAARAFMASYGTLFGLREPASELQLMQQAALPSSSAVRFQQVYKNVPVLGGELIVQSDAQRAVVSAGGEALPDLQLSVEPGISADAARERALSALAKAYGLGMADLQASAPQLWIFNPALLGGPGARVSRLVWRLELTPAASAAGMPIRELVLIDAQTGALALHFNQIADAKKRFVCNDKNAIDPDGDQDNNCVPGKYARVEGQAATGNADVDLAYDYAGITYDYFFNNFGRDSLDGKGLPLISLVKYCPNAQNCPFENANWDGHQMTYGDGFASADDVVGHELSHAITEFTSHLFYYYQSGAMNESMSDVFGELIDQTDGRGNDAPGVKWLMGEDLPASIGVIRDMRDPRNYNHPDRTGSPYYYGDTGDRGGVHFNSGVNNKAAYLMTDGATFNGYTISGLGAAKVGAIYYTVQSAFLTSASDYEDLSNALPAACAALAASGAHGVTTNDCAQVKKAVLATEMDRTPPAAPVEEAPLCAPGLASHDSFYEDFEHPGSGMWASTTLQGENAWFYPALNNPFGVDFTYATSGKHNLWGYAIGGTQEQPGEPADYAIGMTQSIAVPANAFMHFRHSFDFEAVGSTAYDGGVVEYSTNNGASWQDAGPLFSDRGYIMQIDDDSSNPLHGREVFTSVSQGYLSSRLDLSSLAGKQVRFRFRIGTDEITDGFGWFIDDLRVYTCGAALPKVSLPTQTLTVSPGTSSLAIDLVMSGASDKTVTVPFTLGGTAVPGTDYTISNNAFVLAPGKTSGRVMVQVLPSSKGKRLTLTLGTPTNATLGTGRVIAVVFQAPRGGIYVPMARR